MKFFSIVISQLLCLCLSAQTVNINFGGANSNRNYQLVIDGKSYYSANAPTSNGRKVVTIPNLSLGTHNLDVYELANGSNTYSDGTSNAPVNGDAVYSKSFQLRTGYDMHITVRGNGMVSFSERRMKNEAQYTQGASPMATTAFNQLLQNVKAKRYQSQKISVLQNAFATAANKFSASQVKQLLLLITSESSRLSLAKSAYLKVVDPANFITVYDVLNTESNRDALDDYVVSKGGTSNSITASENNTAYSGRTAMSDADFSQLYQKASKHFFQDNTIEDIRNAFAGSVAYFSAEQVRQLLSLVNAETERLALAKMAFSRASDPHNFSQLSNLFNVQQNRDEWNNYINSGSSTVGGATPARTAMSAATFNQLYQKARNHFFQSSTVSDVQSAFTNTANYFSTEQVRQMLLLVKAEADRLALAKLAYSRTVDANNFSQLGDLFTTQANKEELASFIRSRQGY